MGKQWTIANRLHVVPSGTPGQSAPPPPFVQINRRYIIAGPCEHPRHSILFRSPLPPTRSFVRPLPPPPQRKSLTTPPVVVVVHCSLQFLRCGFPDSELPPPAPALAGGYFRRPQGVRGEGYGLLPTPEQSCRRGLCTRRGSQRHSAPNPQRDGGGPRHVAEPQQPDR